MVAANVFTKLNVEPKPDPARILSQPYGFGCPAAFDRKPTRAPDVSCRTPLHERRILPPYAIGDEYGAFNTGGVDDLLPVMEWLEG